MRVHSLIVTHIILTTITRMRPFYNRLPVGSRSRLRSYSISLQLAHFTQWLEKGHLDVVKMLCLAKTPCSCSSVIVTDHEV